MNMPVNGSNGNALLVLSVENAHCDGCGSPPAIVKRRNGDPHTYVGYFENQYGEQWIVEIDRMAKTGVLRGGDIGWERVVPLRENKVDDDLIFSHEEARWLALCWHTATGGNLQVVAPGLSGGVQAVQVVFPGARKSC